MSLRRPRGSATSPRAFCCARCWPIPKLKGVSALIFDEFHERHLYGDITLARALQIQETARPDLIVIVMSATLDVGAVEKYHAALRGADLRGPDLSGGCRISDNSPLATAPVWDLAVRERRNGWCASMPKATC